jgi:heme/copper-type cytochrome/quinol oxidase subunit 1
MLSAKLFAALAILQIGFALLAARAANQSLDVYFHATYFVIAPIHLQILLALSSACFASVYFAFFRWLSNPLSNSLGLTHFVMATMAFVLRSTFLFAPDSTAIAEGLPPAPPSSQWPLLAAALGVLSFLLGCATLAVNFTWTAITILRSRRRLGRE